MESPTITILNKFGVDPSTYTLANVGGVIIGTNNETGAEISRDGRLEIGFAVELAKKDCESTDFAPDNTRAEGIKLPNSSGLYLESILMDAHYLESGPSSANFYTVLVDREKQCWAWADGRALLYRDSSGDAKVIKTIYLTEDEILDFLRNR